MKKRELLYALGATIAAFVGSVGMSYLINRAINWPLAILFTVVFGLSFGVLSFMKARNNT
ncbi:MAG: hypothetical protein M5U34_34050 [Chloroflexi bacterium]|nr:hypothetical protein [Chloroflexota bacterium]